MADPDQQRVSTSDTNSAAIAIGNAFTSYDAVRSTIDRYHAEHFCQLWKRDSWTHASHKNKGYRNCQSKTLNKNLKYAYVNFSCVCIVVEIINQTKQIQPLNFATKSLLYRLSYHPIPLPNKQAYHSRPTEHWNRDKIL